MGREIYRETSKSIETLLRPGVNNHYVLIFRVLHEHMEHLAQIITLNHKDLRIPKVKNSKIFLPLY